MHSVHIFSCTFKLIRLTPKLSVSITVRSDIDFTSFTEDTESSLSCEKCVCTMSFTMVTINKKTIVVCLLLAVFMAINSICAAKSPCRDYPKVEASLVDGRHSERNLENMRAAFFPESNTPPLQVIVTYTINGTATTWSWSLNLVYTLGGARYLAELGMGIPVISVLKVMGKSHLATPFLKVGNLALQLDDAPVGLSHNKDCLAKLTSLVSTVCSM